MEAGVIFYSPKFEFKNGLTGKKLLILLNTPINDDPYIICKTTSNRKNKSLSPGCQIEKSLFLILKDTEFFTEDTWLQLYELYEFSQCEFLKQHFEDNLKQIGKLQNITLRQIRNCINKLPDIMKYHIDLINKSK